MIITGVTITTNDRCDFLFIMTYHPKIDERYSKSEMMSLYNGWLRMDSQFMDYNNPQCMYVYIYACDVCSIDPELILNHDGDTNDTHLNTMIINVIVVMLFLAPASAS